MTRKSQIGIKKQIRTQLQYIQAAQDKIQELKKKCPHIITEDKIWGKSTYLGEPISSIVCTECGKILSTTPAKMQSIVGN